MGDADRTAECHKRAGTILAVDDEHLVLSLLETMLRKQGFTVLTAANGVEALRVFSSAQKDVNLVITDVVMPEMDGTILAEHLLQMRPDLPVLFISGFSERLERIRAPILAKPFSPAVLVGKVRALLGLEPGAVLR